MMFAPKANLVLIALNAPNKNIDLLIKNSCILYKGKYPNLMILMSMDKKLQVYVFSGEKKMVGLLFESN